VAADQTDEQKFESVAQKFRKDKVKFYRKGLGALGFLNKGLWVLHHRRDAGIQVDGVDALAPLLQRVMDGSAKFAPLPPAGEDL
jgi:hypothetical protein